MRNTMLPPRFNVVIYGRIPALDSVAGYAAVVHELERGAREDARDTVRPARQVSK